MADRVLFATRNWANLPYKPDGVTQEQWDAEGSSGFNGFPFAIPSKTHKLTYSGGGGWDTSPDKVDIVEWDGSTYYEYDTGLEVGYPGAKTVKVASSSSSYLAAVVGPGTPWVKLPRKTAIYIYWVVKGWTFGSGSTAKFDGSTTYFGFTASGYVEAGPSVTISGTPDTGAGVVSRERDLCDKNKQYWETYPSTTFEAVVPFTIPEETVPEPEITSPDGSHSITINEVEGYGTLGYRAYARMEIPREFCNRSIVAVKTEPDYVYCRMGFDMSFSLLEPFYVSMDTVRDRPTIAKDADDLELVGPFGVPVAVQLFPPEHPLHTTVYIPLEISLNWDGGEVSATGTVTFSGHLAPVGYWPYANSEGNPVWDATTGARTASPNN